MGLLGDQGRICSLPSNCDVETHTIVRIRSSHAAVPPALQPLLQGWGEPGGLCEATWKEQLAALIKLEEDSKQPGERDILGKNNS